MIGIVVVSHNKKLGDEIIELCKEMQNKEFKLLNGGGMEEGRFGSNPLVIKTAIEEAYEKDGVLIFCDLGSSILNSEMAIEFIEGEEYNKELIKIADAPIVEGAILAVSMNDENIKIENIEKELEDLKAFKKV
ncbi:MAG: dihydroxyacetone kinase phosphoryl donor subunit DhaM [Fusobacterium sp. JB021]|nr:dihydroxyacetone kinase phosphoryl donor subunit DhaM [Fusobacterium sp. JB021]MDP0507382.1 dihydroxyacetone kinase phosphoryl donor subunit DhaM [Fusobacterium sp. JB019]